LGVRRTANAHTTCGVHTASVRIRVWATVLPTPRAAYMNAGRCVRVQLAALATQPPRAHGWNARKMRIVYRLNNVLMANVVTHAL